MTIILIASQEVIILNTWFQQGCIKEDTLRVETNLGVFLKINKL